MKNFWRAIINSTSLLIALLWTVAPLTVAHSVAARELPEKFPRLANYFLKAPISIAEARLLARWDVLVLGVELQYISPQIFPTLRELNPDIILLAYIPSEEFPVAAQSITDTQHPHYKLFNGIADEWWLHDAAGNRMGYWPGTQMLNVTNNAPVVNGEHWNTYLPNYAHDIVMATGLWDGIFYDNVWPDISWINNGNIDLNNDGIVEAASVIDTAWRDGMSSLLAYSRRLEGNDAVIIGNGGGQYYSSMNGRLVEDFAADARNSWTGEMKTYVDVMLRGASPALVLVNGKSTTGLATDYRAMRFGLASTLLDNGFFSFDKGTQSHAETWWFDEYAIALGQPVTTRRNLLRGNDATIQPGVWRRDFENGIVLLNSTTTSRNVQLANAFEEISGTKAAGSGTGEIVTNVTLPPLDGKILLRRQFVVNEGEYENGAFVRQFNSIGNATRQGFYTYDDAYAGGADIIKRDLDADGDVETVTTENSMVVVMNTAGTTIARFRPYGPSYRRAIHITVGDLDGDGKLEIVTGTGTGAGPHVRVFSRTGTPWGPGFFAYGKRFRGGVNVTLGDLDGDGKDEIITGAGKGGGPQVRLFTASGRLLGSFFAYNKKFRGGVDVAAGDLAGDRADEIVTGAGPGGGPHIRIFSGRGKTVLPGFFAFDEAFRGGVNVTVHDINHDLQNDILVSTNALY